MTQDELKTQVGQAALKYVHNGEIVGVGTGSTVNKFIDAMAAAIAAGELTIAGTVSSSVASTERLQALGIPVFEAAEVESLSVYIDGADEIDHQGHMVKGGGAALTREKIVAAQSKMFVCIADESKLVDALGAFPLPVEVIPMARSLVAREMVALGGQPLRVVGRRQAQRLEAQLGQRFDGGISARAFVLGKRLPRYIDLAKCEIHFALCNLHRKGLSAELAGRLRRQGFLMRSECKSILRLATDFPLLGHFFGG